MKKLGFLTVFLITTLAVWGLNPRSVAERGVLYLGSPLPAGATAIEGNANGLYEIVENKNGDYYEQWAFHLDSNKKVDICFFYVYSPNQNVLRDAQQQLNTIPSLYNLKLLTSTDGTAIYITEDIFQHAFGFNDSLSTSRSGKTYYMVMITTFGYLYN
jgi:hypothetical protein